MRPPMSFPLALPSPTFFSLVFREKISAGKILIILSLPWQFDKHRPLVKNTIIHFPLGRSHQRVLQVNFHPLVRHLHSVCEFNMYVGKYEAKREKKVA